MDLRFAICGLRLAPHRFVLSACCFLTLTLLACGGCASPGTTTSPPAEKPAGSEGRVPERARAAAMPGGFAPIQIEILPLTELQQPPSGDQGAQLNVYVSLLDAFGSQIKAPGTMRFELYDYLQRSAEPKGRRIAIWPDIDLTNPSENQKYWRDFLRAYEFTLPAPVAQTGPYILEATCTCPGPRRLSAEFLLKPGN